MSSKGIELTPIQIKALESGATMFIFPISDYDLNRINKGYSIGDSIHINKSDKDIFVQEEFQLNGYDFWNVIYKNTCLNIPTPFKWIPASQMTKEQSRYSFSECIAVRIVKVQDITYEDKLKICQKFTYVENAFWRTKYFKDFYNQQMKEQNINRTYEDNDYVFLVEFA